MDSAAPTLRLGTTHRRLDLDAIHQGKPLECPFRPGLTVTILPAATYNPRYKKALQAWGMRLSERANGSGEVEISDHLEDPVFVADALVADMAGIYDGEGNPVEYTAEIGRRVLGADANADVLSWVANAAHDYGRYYAEDVEAAAKN